jgi:predicted PurR-regulated permease PerM
VRDAPKIGPAISDVAHQPGYRQDADRLINSFVIIWNAYLRGQVILALTVSIAVSLVLTILGVSNSLALGALAGLLEFLPIIGPIISTVAAILVVIFQPENYWGLSPLWHALLVAVAMLAIQQFENSVLVPRIVGGALDLHPLVIMVAVLMGASLAGILGAVLAAPVVATIKLLGGYAWRKMLDLPPFANMDPGSDPPDDDAEESASEPGKISASSDI